MNGPLTRVLLRYGVGVLMAHGYLSGSLGHMVSNDPDVAMLAEMLVGGAISLFVEGYYVLAKKYGWPT